MNEKIKTSLKLASNILLFVTLALMVATIYFDNFYLSIATISLSVISIAVCVVGADEINAKVFTKDLNIYFFLVAIILSLSVTIANQVVFYVGIVLFILVIVLYLIPMFVAEKEEKTKKSSKKKK